MKIFKLNFHDAMLNANVIKAVVMETSQTSLVLIRVLSHEPLIVVKYIIKTAFNAS